MPFCINRGMQSARSYAHVVLYTNVDVLSQYHQHSDFMRTMQYYPWNVSVQIFFKFLFMFISVSVSVYICFCFCARTPVKEIQNHCMQARCSIIRGMFLMMFRYVSLSEQICFLHAGRCSIIRGMEILCFKFLFMFRCVSISVCICFCFCARTPRQEGTAIACGTMQHNPWHVRNRNSIIRRILLFLFIYVFVSIQICFCFCFSAERTKYIQQPAYVGEAAETIQKHATTQINLCPTHIAQAMCFCLCLQCGWPEYVLFLFLFRFIFTTTPHRPSNVGTHEPFCFCFLRVSVSV